MDIFKQQCTTVYTTLLIYMQSTWWQQELTRRDPSHAFLLTRMWCWAKFADTCKSWRQVPFFSTSPHPHNQNVTCTVEWTSPRHGVSSKTICQNYVANVHAPLSIFCQCEFNNGLNQSHHFFRKQETSIPILKLPELIFYRGLDCVFGWGHSLHNDKSKIIMQLFFLRNI